METFIRQAPSVMDVIIEAYQRKVTQTISVNPLFYDDIQKYPKVMHYINKKHDRAYGRFVGLLQRGVGEGYFRSDVDYELVAQMFNAINRYIMNQHLLKSYTKQQLFTNMMLIPLRGFCTEKGLEVLDNSFKTL